ncbi:hypothetical protein CPT_Marzo_228 [Stenotrophomonas phage Marzo]|nr:hypothetical protein CPT_Marzo_228 [Stenotrophomonas phage Marzo]
MSIKSDKFWRNQAKKTTATLRDIRQQIEEVYPEMTKNFICVDYDGTINVYESRPKLDQYRPARWRVSQGDEFQGYDTLDFPTNKDEMPGYVNSLTEYSRFVEIYEEQIKIDLEVFDGIARDHSGMSARWRELLENLDDAELADLRSEARKGLELDFSNGECFIAIDPIGNVHLFNHEPKWDGEEYMPNWGLGGYQYIGQWEGLDYSVNGEIPEPIPVQVFLLNKQEDVKTKVPEAAPEIADLNSYISQELRQELVFALIRQGETVNMIPSQAQALAEFIVNGKSL